MANLIKGTHIFDPVLTPSILYKFDKIYLMDNHLLAIWCWLQEVKVEEKYNFFHIDRHYDLLPNTTDKSMELLESLQIDLSKIDVDTLIDINKENKILTHDNYIIVFDRLYQNLVNKVFVTHNDGFIPHNWNERAYKTKFYELFDNIEYWVKSYKEQAIINIDLDYFIRKYDDNNCLQIFSDEYIKMIGNEIKSCYEKVEVITIALTPTFCCGIDKPKMLSKILIESILEREIEI